MIEEQLRCRAITKAGSQCKNNAQAGSDYCHVHRNYIGKKTPAVEVDDAVQEAAVETSNRAELRSLLAELSELTEELILTATTDVPASIEWFQNNQSIGAGNSIPFTPAEGTNTVIAVATDDNGCTDSSTVTIIYLPLDGGIADPVLMVCLG